MTTVHRLQSFVELYQRIHDLKVLPRTGWLLAGVADPESLADHTCGVALSALFLAEQINSDPASEALAAPLSVERVLSLALIHDLAESVLTDLPRRSTAVLGEPVKHQAEATVMARLLADLPQGPHYRILWQEYVEQTSPEARLIKDVDKLEMVSQALHYAARGHRTLHEFWEGHTFHYTASQALYTALREAFDALVE